MIEDLPRDATPSEGSPPVIRFVAPARRLGGTPEDWTRREFLRIGGLGLAGSGLGWPLRGRSALGENANSNANLRSIPGFGKAKSVLIIYANGGQSQFETWDPKPEAPEEVRGAFGSISTAVPGTILTEHLPLLARLADRYTIVRSMSHDDLDHGSAAYLTFTGHYHPRKSSNPPPSPEDYPSLAALLQRVRPAQRSPYTALHVNAPVLVPELPAPGQGGGLLGKAYDPFVIGDPTDVDGLPSLALPEELPLVRLQARRGLLETIEGYRRDLLNDSEALAKTDLYRQAYDLLSDPSCQEAFDLSAEPESLRDRYGRFRSGQACLLGRRLVEAGVPLITVVWNHSARGQDNRPDEADHFGWDTHNDIFDLMQGHLLPRFDQSISTLIEDLDSRGLLEETLVVILGEFGRAPRVALEPRFAGASPGRKHWANVYSIVVAGAGVTRGALLGASDRIGAYPKTERYGPWDVSATIFSALGIDPATEYRDPLGRPFVLSTGKPMIRLYS